MSELESVQINTLMIDVETPEEFTARKFDGVTYTKQYTNPEYTEFELLCADKGVVYRVQPEQDLYQEWLALGNAPVEIAYIAPAYPYGLENLDPDKRMRAVFWKLVKERYDLDETEARERLLDAVADPSTDEAIQILAVRKNLTAEVQQLEADYQASLEE